MISHSTQVPNDILDEHLPHLKPSEVLVLLIIVRQTLGWVNKNGKRKVRDWISQRQFIRKTGLSARTISRSIDRLIAKGMVRATDYRRTPLTNAHQRKGRTRIYYQYLSQKNTAKNTLLNTQKLPTTKLTLTKNTQGVEKLSDWERYQQIKRSEYG